MLTGKLTFLPSAQFGSQRLVTSVPLPFAVEPPKLDQLRFLSAVLPSPQARTTVFGFDWALLQLVTLSGEDADAGIANAATSSAAMSSAPVMR